MSRYLEQERAALASYELAGDLRRALNESISVGYAYMELGAYHEAEEALSAALDAAEKSGLVHPAAAARHNLGLVVAHLGRVDEGIAIERAAVATFVVQQDLRLEAAGRIYLACIHLLAGQYELAAHEATEGIALAKEAAPPVVPMGLAALAQARLAEGRADDALAAISAALERVQAGGDVEGGDSLLLPCAGRDAPARYATTLARALQSSRRAIACSNAPRASAIRLCGGAFSRTSPTTRARSSLRKHGRRTVTRLDDQSRGVRSRLGVVVELQAIDDAGCQPAHLGR